MATQTNAMLDALLARVDRLESLEAIRGLIARYAVLVDARDVDGLLELYTDDYRVGSERGLQALRESFFHMLGAGTFTTTVHFVGQQDIELDAEDSDRARGVVYCRAEHECGPLWIVATLQYWDRYERRDGRWLFAHRRLRAFYVADVLERPTGPDRVKHQLTDVGLLGRPEVPEAWPSWERFHAELRRRRRA
jgi:ketosteroid isomerase-like protein